MSTTANTTQATTVEQELSDQQARLAIEAGKYLGLQAGDPLPKSEVEAQARANGYTDREASDLVSDLGETIEVPPQGDLFGDLWRDDPSPTRLDPFDLPDKYLVSDNVGISPKSETQSWEERPKTHADSCHPEPLDSATEDIYALYEPVALDPEDVGGDSRYLEDGEPVTAFEAVGAYIRRRHGQNTSAKTEGYTTKQQEQLDLYGVAKEMDRQLLRKYDNPTIALLSLRVSPSPVRRRVTLLEAISDAWDETRGALRYRLQEAPDAPLTASQWEYFAVFAGTAERGTPHLHFVVYCEGDVSRSCFEPVVEKFVEKCPYAPDDGRGNDPSEGTISIHGNGDDTIPRMDEAPEESAGATYVLKQLPHLSDVDEMARDELLHASSVDAWGGRSFRKSEYDVGDDEEDSGVITTLSESEIDFVDDYLAAGLDPDPDLITTNIDENFSQFPDGANAGAIVSAIQERLEGRRRPPILRN